MDRKVLPRMMDGGGKNSMVLQGGGKILCVKALVGNSRFHKTGENHSFEGAKDQMLSVSFRPLEVNYSAQTF